VLQIGVSDLSAGDLLGPQVPARNAPEVLRLFQGQLFALRAHCGRDVVLPAKLLTVSYYSVIQVKIAPARRSGLPARRFELKTGILSSPQTFSRDRVLK
jgi:hypothetical protein